VDNKGIYEWLQEQFCVEPNQIIEALKLSPSAQGYIHGALSEILLIQYLAENDYEVLRIKEKPAGGFDEKKMGYKGDFLIKKKGDNNYYVVECKGLKTNSEFRSGDTDENDHQKRISKEQAFNTLKKYINIDKNNIYQKGYNRYLKTKNDWEKEHPNKTFPKFRWTRENPGPDNANLSDYFSSISELKKFIENADDERLSEKAFRTKNALYKILQTHEPSDRTDDETGIKQAAPLVSDFSMMAVDLFQRTGKHEFVFMNPDCISHSPTSPNHLYQNYIIDVLIPGVKDELDINHPWYRNIDDCIKQTRPKTVEYDSTQIDYREA
jgi:hypothetical protein